VNHVPLVPALLLVSIVFGCVERKLHIRTEPEGATVSVNGHEVGPSPATWEFQQYGTVRVTVRKKGYETEQRIVKLKIPWYEYPVLDLFSDVIVPVRIENDHHIAIGMKARESTPKDVDKQNAAALGQRAVALRDELRSEIAREAAREAAQAAKQDAARESPGESAHESAQLGDSGE